MTVREAWQLLQDEVTQRREEGCEVTELQERVAALKAKGAEPSAQEVEELWALAETLQPLPTFPYSEPSDWEALVATWQELPPLRVTLRDGELYDRIKGAWLGRVAGCMVGKPVEGWHKSKIDRYLQRAGEYPLQGYFPPLPQEDPELRVHDHRLLRGNITKALRDDDIDYTLLGLYLVERHGHELTPDKVGRAWLELLPYHKVYTAERCAYRNLVNGLQPPETALYRNPYREWIGAQIRADFFGYACPGDPREAARLAYQDAVVSHQKNGIYGELWVAATIAAALVCDDLETALQAGLSVIPKTSRLAEALRDAITWGKECATWEEAWAKANEKYGSYHPVHTINNAVLVVLGLMFGQDDFTRTVGYAVMGGWDTDCNGATAGSIWGALFGANKLPTEMISPLGDEYETALSGFGSLRLSELIDRTFRLAQAFLTRQ